MKLTKEYLTGWRKSDCVIPEHEVGFSTTDECLMYLRGELSWLSIDLPTSDPLGNQAMNVAVEMARISLYLDDPFNDTKTWTVGAWTYYVRKNPEWRRARAARKAGL